MLGPVNWGQELVQNPPTPFHLLSSFGDVFMHGIVLIIVENGWQNCLFKPFLCQA